MMSAVAKPTYRETYFIGGPMHRQWFSVPDTADDIVMRFSSMLTFSPLGRDRYTRRKFTRLVRLEPVPAHWIINIEVAYLMAHEDWLDEDLPASIIPDTAWRKAEDEELA